jgi:hypothetical protein
MAVEVYKAKSMTPEKTDEQIKRECGVIRFISFEGAIQLFRKECNLMGLEHAPMGYRVTEQGIEILTK